MMASEPLQQIFADLHVHIGAADGGPVKITASRSLTFASIAHEAAHRKGIAMVGVVDACCTGVLREIRQLLASGQLTPAPGGGLRYEGALTVVLGAELEAVEDDGPLHTLSYFPDLQAAEAFSKIMARHVTNLSLSSQNTGLALEAHVAMTQECGGFLIPAHAFTPFKGAYSVTPRIADLVAAKSWASIPGLELGLSADTALAQGLPELESKTFLSNSDAHSLPRIGREYNRLLLKEASFAELKRGLLGEAGRAVTANYGLDPRLGKYYRSFCPHCDARADGPPPVTCCPRCGSRRGLVLGVRDRLMLLDQQTEKVERPPYYHQVPLSFVPGVGPRTIDRLLEAFGHEMHVLHRASAEELSRVVGERLAGRITAARAGRLTVEAGGGGRYGRVH